MQFWVALASIVSFLGTVESRATKATHIRNNGDLLSSYDFIIIGGGASGLTVADRLTENRKTTVLVLEYGPFDSHEPSVLVPGLLNLSSTPYWFNLTSTPQKHLNNRTFAVTIASAVGGGTVINGMFFHRGARADYTIWETLGAKGWGWNDLFPYFKKSETFTAPDPAFAEEWGIEFEEDVHGHEGPIQASYPPYQFPVIKDFFKGFRELNVTTPRDPDDGSAKGAFWVPSTLDPKNRTRSYARTAHYDRVIRKRKNYHLLSLSAATKILFDERKRAVGVEYMNRETGQIARVSADKEVILAAGAVHTPQVLLLSGIGERRELDRLGVTSISDVPGVGYNFQDHPTIFFVNQFSNDTEPSIADLNTNATYQQQQLDLYWTRREGAYTIVALGGNTAAFVPLPDIVSEASANSLVQAARTEDPAAIYFSVPPSVLDSYNLQREVLIDSFKGHTLPVQETGFNGPFIPVTLLHPLSRGRISLNGTKPLSAPLVDYSALSSPTDLAVLISSIRFNRRLLQTSSLTQRLPIELVPGSNVTSDTDLEAAMRNSVTPTYQHPCCTAPMLPLSRGGVVDPETLTVYGVQGLSIVDASVMPVIPGAHLMGTVYGVAEKAADMIKKRHGLI
ncbi:choline dehydrogenase-like protein [Corynespora cassiicola Philippines]|uniref:Choline dehydrogenase-like protein n=1 Tax=Corynespora cassiicola Philippines TaxID=1448308 RepID=A0A2T2NRX0_CORCC|nr:choline dehydrogenase-like protein [Corynespora cassiicola Philippines]